MLVEAVVHSNKFIKDGFWKLQPKNVFKRHKNASIIVKNTDFGVEI